MPAAVDWDERLASGDLPSFEEMVQEHGETEEAVQATEQHGDFHERPDFRGSDEELVPAPQMLGIATLVSLGEHGRMPGVRFVPPKSWTSGRPGGPPRWIIIHYTAGSEGPTAAEDGVAYDQRRNDGTSAHFYTDRNSIIQCVDCDNRSHTAKYYGNLWGIHIEQCGTVQTRAQWLDDASYGTIKNTAKVCAWAMKQYNIPFDRIVARELRTQKGIGGHKDVTLGFPEDNGSHMDPDGHIANSYPYDKLFEEIKKILDGSTEEEDDMDPSTVVPRPSNVAYPVDVSHWPTTGGTSEPTLAYMIHVMNSRSATMLTEQRANEAARKTEEAATQALVKMVADALKAGGGDLETSAVLAKITEEAEKTRKASLELQEKEAARDRATLQAALQANITHDI